MKLNWDSAFGKIQLWSHKPELPGTTDRGHLQRGNLSVCTWTAAKTAWRKKEKVAWVMIWPRVEWGLSACIEECYFKTCRCTLCAIRSSPANSWLGWVRLKWAESKNYIQTPQTGWVWRAQLGHNMEILTLDWKENPGIGSMPAGNQILPEAFRWGLLGAARFFFKKKKRKLVNKWVWMRVERGPSAHQAGSSNNAHRILSGLFPSICTLVESVKF
jgi:hypothetical protein